MNNFLEKIRNFREQFTAKLEIRDWNFDVVKKKFLFCGMGGSHLAADLLRIYNSEIDSYIHSDYDLPQLLDLKERFVFIISYSGNTQETISSLNSALRKKLKVGVITLGGKILNLAEKYELPRIVLPDLNIQPRLAVGLIFRAILKIIKPKDCLKLENSMKKFNPKTYEDQGKKLAQKIKNAIPIVYCSRQNFPLANYFKISFNETSKSPSFVNYFPELNHNEMVGFLYQRLAKNFYFLFLQDQQDHFLVQKRMKILNRWLKNKQYKTTLLNITKKNIFEKIFSSVILALFVSYYLALFRNVSPADASIINKFKRYIS